VGTSLHRHDDLKSRIDGVAAVGDARALLPLVDLSTDRGEEDTFAVDGDFDLMRVLETTDCF